MIRVLIVDDDALTLQAHTAFVERIDGFTVAATCTGARAALAVLLDGGSRPPVDLVLLDMSMPDGSGLDVLRHARARVVDVDVIAITGVRDAEVVRRTASLGVLQYLVKPFTFAVFRERLEHYRKHRERHERTVGQATQAEIDSLLGGKPSAQPPPPKGLSGATREAVIADLREHSPTSATEAASRVGLSRVAARRYLESLVADRLADRRERHGTRGRPVVEYHWRTSSTREG